MFTVDRSHSEVGFNVRHFFTKVPGRFGDYSGAIVFDPENLTASSAEIAIRDSTIDTDNEKRDRHLRTEEFFWAEKHPLITFKSTRVIPGKDGTHFRVEGDLTIRGITKRATLDVEYLGMGAVTVGGQSLGTQAGFNATTTINRKDWGITWNRTLDQGGTMLGDAVEITLTVAAVSKDQKPETTGARPDSGKAPAVAEKKP